MTGALVILIGFWVLVFLRYGFACQLGFHSWGPQQKAYGPIDVFSIYKQREPNEYEKKNEIMRYTGDIRTCLNCPKMQAGAVYWSYGLALDVVDDAAWFDPPPEYQHSQLREPNGLVIQDGGYP